jgi:hypothetical protein
MSGKVADLKLNPDNDGPLGQQVCTYASKNKCHSGTENPGKGGDDRSTPPSGDDHGAAPEAGDDHGKPEVTPPTTPTTGSIETGEDHSGGQLPSSSETGKGKSGRDD